MKVVELILTSLLLVFSVGLFLVSALRDTEAAAYGALLGFGLAIASFVGSAILVGFLLLARRKPRLAAGLSILPALFWIGVAVLDPIIVPFLVLGLIELASAIWVLAEPRVEAVEPAGVTEHIGASS